MFKDNDTINQRDQVVYASNLKSLADVISENGLGSEAIRIFLLEGAEPERTPHRPKHTGCSYRNTDGATDRIPVTEKRICRCMYYFNCPEAPLKQQAKCEVCDFPGRRKNISDYIILDYEVPMPYVVSGAGGIDLLVQSTNGKIYAVEVKPDNSKETLVRMIAEILTYCEISDYTVLNRGHSIPVQPAICFFRDSQQWNDYFELLSNLDFKFLLKLIKVFYITMDDSVFKIHDAEVEPICR